MTLLEKKQHKHYVIDATFTHKARVGTNEMGEAVQKHEKKNHFGEGSNSTSADRLFCTVCNTLANRK